MLVQITALRDYAIQAKQILEKQLLEKLANEYAANFIASEFGYYDVVASDNPMVKNYKILLNILNAASNFSGSMFDLLRTAEIYSLKKQLDTTALKQAFSIFASLYDGCPKLFKLVLGDDIEPIANANADQISAEAYDKAVAESLSGPEKSSVFNPLINQLQTLKNLEEINLEQKPAKKNHSNEIFIQTQNKIKEFITKIFSEEQQSTFTVDKNGNYEIFADDDVSVKNAKFTLNGLLGLQNLYGAWNQLYKAGQGASTITNLAEMYNSFRMMQASLKQICSIQNKKEIASDISDVIRETLVKINSVMEKMLCVLDQLEDIFGLRPGTLVEQFKPTIDAFIEAINIMQPHLNEEIIYPYWTTRINALRQENKTTLRLGILAEMNINKIKKMQEIVTGHGSDPLSSYNGKDLETILENLNVLNLDDSVKDLYVQYLNQEIANQNNTEKKVPEASGWNLWGAAINILERTGNAAGTTIHSVVARQINEQLEACINEKIRLEQQAKLTFNHIKVLETEQAKNSVFFIAKKAEAALQEQAEPIEKNTSSPKRKNFLSTVVSILKLAFENILKPKIIDLPEVKETDIKGSSLLKENIAKKKPHLFVIKPWKNGRNVDFNLKANKRGQPELNITLEMIEKQPVQKHS